MKSKVWTKFVQTSDFTVKALIEGYFGVCGIAVSGVISARYCGIKGKNWRYCGIELLQRGMRYR